MKFKKEQKSKGSYPLSNAAGQLLGNNNNCGSPYDIQHQHKCSQQTGNKCGGSGGSIPASGNDSSSDHFRSPGVIISATSPFSGNDTVKCLTNLTDQLEEQETGNQVKPVIARTGKRSHKTELDDQNDADQIDTKKPKL